MSKVTSPPKFSDVQYRVVGPLGTGAGSTILQIADRSRGGKRFALKVVKRQDSDDDVYIAQAQTEYEAAQKLNHPAIAADLRLPDQKIDALQGHERRVAHRVR